MNITPLAQKKIDQTLSGKECLRVSLTGGGCNGFTAGIAQEVGAVEGDIWISANVVVDPSSDGYLEEATLDWIDDPFKSTFHFSIPNTRSCGCGESFQFEGK
jgi:iron-sulfur cluster insertion protein